MDVLIEAIRTSSGLNGALSCHIFVSFYFSFWGVVGTCIFDLGIRQLAWTIAL
jgi:hypothetical protein